MKKVRKAIGFLSDLNGAISLIILVAGIVIAGAAVLVDWGQTPITLPLWGLVLLFFFSSYAPLRLIEYLFKNYRKPVFSYAELKWKPAIFPFQNPAPLCPICEREMSPKTSPPTHSVLVSPRRQEIPKKRSYWFECPIHGNIYRGPDEPSEKLQKKARIIQDEK